LSRLARSGLSGHDHDLVVPDDLGDVVAALDDRQLGWVADGGRQHQLTGLASLGAVLWLGPSAASVALTPAASLPGWALPLRSAVLVAGTPAWGGVLGGHAAIVTNRRPKCTCVPARPARVPTRECPGVSGTPS